MKNNLKDFIASIIKEASLDNMPQNFIEEYTERLTFEAQKRLGLVSMKELDEPKHEELNKIIEESNNEPQKINDFLVANIENFEEKMTIALEEFGKEVLEAAKKLQTNDKKVD